MAERHPPARDPPLMRQLVRTTPDLEQRRAALVPHHLDVVKVEIAQTDTERLHHRFLRRESGRQTLRRIVLTRGVLPFVGTEEAGSKRCGPFHRESEPTDLDEIGTEPDDAHDRGQRRAIT